MQPVTIFTTSWCGECHVAKRLFDDASIGYDEVEIDRSAERVRFRATTAGGEPVDIQLIARAPETTDLRIRVGVFGDETTSRLVLEEIHQSL